jgi:hypothetical protein
MCSQHHRVSISLAQCFVRFVIVLESAMQQQRFASSLPEFSKAERLPNYVESSFKPSIAKQTPFQNKTTVYVFASAGRCCSFSTVSLFVGAVSVGFSSFDSSSLADATNDGIDLCGQGHTKQTKGVSVGSLTESAESPRDSTPTQSCSRQRSLRFESASMALLLLLMPPSMGPSVRPHCVVDRDEFSQVIEQTRI